MALPMRVAAGENRHRPGRVNAHLGGFVQAGAGADGAGDIRRRQAAGLDIAAYADAAKPTARLGFSLARSETGVVCHRQRLVQHCGVVAAIVLQRHRRLIRKCVGGDEIAAAQLRTVDAHFARRQIDQPFDYEGRLRPPGTALCIDRGGVGEHAVYRGVNGRCRVLSGQHCGMQIGRDQRPERGQIDSEIGVGRDAQTQELAARIQCQLGMSGMVTAMGVRQERLAAIHRPFDRPSDLLRRPGDGRLLGIMRDLRAEAAADIGRDHSQLLLGSAEHEGAHQQSYDMRNLAGCV